VGGLPEIVREGVTGVLVPPRAPDALAARLTDLARDRVLAERLGANARADAARRFALPQQIRALVGVYEGVLSSPSHGRRSLPSRSRVAAGEPS
jgi:glycosyltransferase involved in cell wall biosynthesis